MADAKTTKTKAKTSKASEPSKAEASDEKSAKAEAKGVAEATVPQYPTDLTVLNERMGALNEPEAKAEPKEES